MKSTSSATGDAGCAPPSAAAWSRWGFGGGGDGINRGDKASSVVSIVTRTESLDNFLPLRHEVNVGVARPQAASALSSGLFHIVVRDFAAPSAGVGHMAIGAGDARLVMGAVAV